MGQNDVVSLRWDGGGGGQPSRDGRGTGQLWRRHCGPLLPAVDCTTQSQICRLETEMPYQWELRFPCANHPNPPGSKRSVLPWPSCHGVAQSPRMGMC